jgi:6-pyruvoyltetrahydropterin/6-carboxytetrahydropterin synthase
MSFNSTKVIELGSCAFRQPKASHSHCRFIHGYKLSAKFWFAANELDKNNWVVDFGGLKGLKEKLRNQFDHTTCIAADDPALPIFRELEKADACDLRLMPNGTGIERVAEYCFNTANFFIKAATNDRCWVEKVEVWEHENNSATYTDIQVRKIRFTSDNAEDNVDWDAYREAEACGPQANPKDFIKSTPLHELGEANDPIDQSKVVEESGPAEGPKTHEDHQEEQRNLPGAARDKSKPIGARVGPGPKSHNAADPFAGTSWGADVQGDPYAPKRG